MEVVWWFVNDELMSLATASLTDDYTVKQSGGFGDRCWGISASRPGVSMDEAIRRMQAAYPHAHRTMNAGMLRGYLEQMPRELEARRHPSVLRQRPPKKAA